MSFGGGGGGNASLTPPVNLSNTGISPVFGARTTGDANNRIEMDADGALRMGAGVIAPAVSVSAFGNQLLTSGDINCQGNLDISTTARGLRVAEGTNAKQGIATLVAGTVTVANTSVTANSRIILTTQTPGGTAGFLVVSARVAGTSFTILSSNAADTSVVAYEIFEPG